MVKYPPEAPLVSPTKAGGLIKKEERIMQRERSGVHGWLGRHQEGWRKPWWDLVWNTWMLPVTCFQRMAQEAHEDRDPWKLVSSGQEREPAPVSDQRTWGGKSLVVKLRWGAGYAKQIGVSGQQDGEPTCTPEVLQQGVGTAGKLSQW